MDTIIIAGFGHVGKVSVAMLEHVARLKEQGNKVILVVGNSMDESVESLKENIHENLITKVELPKLETLTNTVFFDDKKNNEKWCRQFDKKKNRGKRRR